MTYYENLHQQAQSKQVIPAHYYGDTIRGIYIVAGLFMILGYPFFSNLLGLPIVIPVVAILMLGIFGGLLSPNQSWVMKVNVVISVIALFVFEFYAVQSFNGGIRGAGPVFFWGNQILAFLFFIAVYLSVKTVRGVVLKK